MGYTLLAGYAFIGIGCIILSILLIMLIATKQSPELKWIFVGISILAAGFGLVVFSAKHSYRQYRPLD